MVLRTRSGNAAPDRFIDLSYACTAAGLAEAVSLVDERLVISKMQRHLLTKFLTLTFLCYLVSATTLLPQSIIICVYIESRLSQQPALRKI